MPLNPSRTVDELRELRELTGDENGAQRVAWTDTWKRAQEWMSSKLDGTGAVESFDAAGNQWWTLPGASEQALILGGHLDSVPNGGWLDGCLNVIAGAEVLRRIAEEGEPPLTVRLVSWADEEGARFGRSLFGSSAAAGSMADQDELRVLKDADGVSLPDAIAALRRRSRLGARRALRARERGGLPRAAHRAGAGPRVDRPAARRRARHLRRRAPPDHVARPGGARRLDADGPAPRRARRRREAGARIAGDRGARSGDGAVMTSGGVVCKPGIVTSVVETAEQLLDMRHLDAGKLAAMPRRARGERALRGRGADRGRVGADLADRADPLRERSPTWPTRRCARWPARRTGSQRPAPRRRRGLARRRADGDALRPEPPRPQPHEARGHEARAPRARRPGARPPGDEDARPVAG